MIKPPRAGAALAAAGMFVLVLTPSPAHSAVPLCWGVAANIIGTEGDDSLYGRSNVRDVIYAGGGNDAVYSGAGTQGDLLCGGPGNDTVFGGAGADKINGGDGDDLVDGGWGSDTVQGNAGNDYLNNETSPESVGNDILRGGIGDDHIETAHGVDKAYGEAGNDTLIDLECSASYLYGGPGADYLSSIASDTIGYQCQPGSSKDVLDGNDGVDRGWASRLDSVIRIESLEREPTAW